ncbi:MAG: type II toxin-antitoxin system HicA family toxin [Pirellulaceae bacterium]|nr:type II toxin-antitoxin system HicA family toxin [Pirellulaceae bacterium]
MACWNLQSGDIAIMPKKIRELVADLLDAGFLEHGGKGSHQDFVHPNVTKPVTLSGRLGDDAKKFQERAVR